MSETGKTIALIEALKGNSGGGGGGVLVVNVTWDGDTGTLDKTWQQINDAAFAVMNVSESQGMKSFAQVTSADEIAHSVMVYDAGNGDYYVFSADSATGYPTGGLSE